MKKLFLITFLFSAFTASAAISEEAPTIATTVAEPEIDVRTMTEAQIFRHARELYRKGDYAAAIPVFKRMLAIDCENRLAQWHLQKIALKGPAYREAAVILKSLPCELCSFTDEDFLPASLYYETDNDLLLAQIILYQKRYLLTKNRIGTQINRYNDINAELETKVQGLSSNLDATRNNKTFNETALARQLQEAKMIAKRMDAEVAWLKEELAATREGHRQQVETLNSQLTNVSTSTTTNTTTIRQEVTQKEFELGTKTERLLTLQAKFADIEARLHRIEVALQERNARLQEMQANLTNIK